MFSIKQISCSKIKATKEVGCAFATSENTEENWVPDLKTAQKKVDLHCKESAKTIGAEITLIDNIIMWQGCPSFTFGIKEYVMREMTNDNREENGADRLCEGENLHGRCLERYFSDPNSDYVHFKDDSGFNMMYKVFCMDIDGLNNGEDPFGYGIRVDGKIILGARAQEWLEKSIQEK